ncbi:MAG: CHAD domain-containing protein [Anaerolineae bacterium]|nr:CHAD domain-containing protein [Anaerolineae bacterium]
MEIEAKFILPDIQALRRLAAISHLLDFRLAAPHTQQMKDTYLDTVDRHILANSYACRWREQANQSLLTIKELRLAQDVIHRREELEIVLPAAPPVLDPARWPASAVRELVQELAGGNSLMPLLAMQQTRTSRLLFSGERWVADLCLDQVQLAAEDRQQAYMELEIELTAQGREKELEMIAAYLGEEWGLKPQRWSKFERALAFLEATLASNLLTVQESVFLEQIAPRDDTYGRRARALLALDRGKTQVAAGHDAGLSDRTVRYWLAAFRKERLNIFPARIVDQYAAALFLPAAPSLPLPRSSTAGRERPALLPKKPGVRRDDSMVEAARKTFLFHLQHMLYHEPGVRAGEDVEALHDMRVATRRLRAAFRVFDGYLEQKRFKPFLRDLRRTGRVLGVVRDLDVFWQKSAAYLSALPPEQRSGLAPLQAAWEEEYRQARVQLLAYLDGARHSRFKEQFRAFLQTPAADVTPPLSPQGEPLPHRLRHVVPVAIYQRLAAVQAYDEWVSGPDPPRERLHQLRIAAKRLRYSVEFFREVMSPESEELVERLKTLQDHLGDLQDAVVASGLLSNFLAWGRWQWGTAALASTQPVTAPGVTAYLETRQREAQELVASFPQLWAGFRAELGPLVAQAIRGLL